MEEQILGQQVIKIIKIRETGHGLIFVSLSPCSVIVDELARWKAGLMQHNEEFSHNVRLALHEHHVLWDTQLKTYLTLKQLKSAFDPLAKDPGPAEKASILGLADHTQKLANELTERLIKEGGVRDVSEDKSQALHPMDTPAEEGLKEVIIIFLTCFLFDSFLKLVV